MRAVHAARNGRIVRGRPALISGIIDANAPCLLTLGF